jgi:branched-chain amino acid transport system substrate-binding protein
MKGKLLTTIIAITVLAFLAACAQTPPSAPPTEASEEPAAEEPAAEESAPEEPKEEVFKIGVLGPHTGTSARVGEELWDGAVMAFEEIDYKIGHYKIELVKIDSESDPEKATRAYEEAIVRQELDMGMINWHSSVSVACMEVAAKHKFAHFIPGGATEVINEKYDSDPEKFSWWIGKNWPVPAKLSSAYIETLDEAIDAGLWTPAQKKAVVYGEDTDWGRSFGQAIRGQLEDAGWEVVSEDYFALDEVEFYPLLKRWKSEDVSLVAGSSTAPPSFSALVKQSREVGLEALFIADGLGWIGEWYELAGDASDYVLDQIPQFTTDEAKTFAAEFEEKWGFAPSPSAAALAAYDVAGFFIQVAQEIYDEYGELSGDLVHQVAWEKIRADEFSYTDGIIMKDLRFTEESFPDPVVGQDYYIFPVIQYFGGEGTLIWPGDWKEADLQIPPWQQ